MIFLTSAAISYLSQSILALVIALYFSYQAVIKRGRNPIHARLFIGVYISVTVLCTLFFLDTAFLPTQRLLVVYLQNTAFAILLVFLVQFAYHYPEKKSASATEIQAALGLTLAYLFVELGIAIWRYSTLWQSSQVEYRSSDLDYYPMVVIAWVVVIFFRNAWKDKDNHAHNLFAATILIPLWLVFIDTMGGYFSREFVQINISIGLLLTTFLFAFNYASYLPEFTPFIAKISGTFLIGMLSTLSGIAWLITPVYSEEFSPRLIDNRTLQFSPNSAGGYDVREISFDFETDLGYRTGIGGDTVAENVPFHFTFFGKPYSELYVIEDGAINFGRYQRAADVQYNFGTVAKLSPAYIDLVAPLSGEEGVYINASETRLVVTWYKMKVFHQEPQTLTIQVILQSDSSFTFTYNGLPSLGYNANSAPGEKVWVLGIKPEGKVAATVDYSQLPLQVAPNGALQDEYREFRGFLHRLMLPLAISMLVSTIILLIILPMLIEWRLSQPLQQLLAGVETFNQKRHALNLPVPTNDEIGYLTKSFNTLTSELDNLIHTLETRVADRTADLQVANRELRKLSTVVEQSPSAIVITDPNGSIEYCNPSFTRVSGYSFDEVKGKNPRLLQSGQTPVETYAQMWKTLLSGKTWRGELVNLRKDGELYWEETVITPIQNAAGKTTYYVSIKEDITARKLAERELERLATTDSLTGLLNRRSFFAKAEKLYERSLHEPYELAVLMMDIDHFKKINDLYGHQAGDMVLHGVANCLLKNLRPTDVIARYGGEEFVVMLPRIPFATLLLLTDRLNATIRETSFTHNDTKIVVTISIGASILTRDSTSLEELLSQADKALYQAKQNGRDRAVIWEKTA